MPGKRKINLITVKPEVYIMFAFALFLLPLRWLLAWLIASLFHEFFHYCALKICKCHINCIQISTNGTIMDTEQMPYGKEAICAIAGPLSGFLLLFIARWLPILAICGFLQSVYNLIPIFPMDGGRILRSMSRKWFDLPVADSICRWTEQIFICALCSTGLYLSIIFSLGPIPLILLAILIFKNKFANKPCKDKLLRVQ